MKTRTAILCCVGGVIAAALGACGFYNWAPHKAQDVPLSKDLLLLAFVAIWIGGCVFFLTSFVWCVIIAIGRRRALHRPEP